MPDTINPYQPPETSAEDIVVRTTYQKIEGTEPFVSADGFYCQPDFEPPLICFLSGVPLPEKSSPTILSTKQTTKVQLYFDPSMTRTHSIYKSLITLFLFAFVFLVCIVTFIIANILVAIIVGLVFLFCVIPRPNSQLTVHDHPSGYVRITGGHPDFLQNYEKRDLEPERSDQPFR